MVTGCTDTEHKTVPGQRPYDLLAIGVGLVVALAVTEVALFLESVYEWMIPVLLIVFALALVVVMVAWYQYRCHTATALILALVLVLPLVTLVIWKGVLANS